MMNIIATAKSLTKFHEYKNDVNDASMVFILYEVDETISAADMAAVYDTHAKLVFIPVESRDDKLLCVGGIRVRLEATILDEELVCPSEFLNKINGVFGNPCRSKLSSDFVPNRGRQTGAQPSSIREAMHASERERKMTMSDVAKASQPSSNGSVNLSKKSQALYDLIGLSAPDVGFMLGTEALMQAIGNAVVAASDDEDRKNRILEMQGGQIIWEKVEPKIPEILQLLG